MSSSRPTAGNGVHRTARLLLATATVIILVAIIACSGEEPPLTDRADKNQQKLAQTIEAVTGQLTALQTETAKSDSTPNPDDQPPATDQTDTNTPGSPLSTNTPTSVEAMKPTGPGICGRSPEVQTTLLLHLNISLCHAVTTPELFRITEFGVAMNSAQQGDFEGLVNVQDMVIRANKFEPSTVSI